MCVGLIQSLGFKSKNRGFLEKESRLHSVRYKLRLSFPPASLPCGSQTRPPQAWAPMPLNKSLNLHAPLVILPSWRAAADSQECAVLSSSPEAAISGMAGGADFQKVSFYPFISIVTTCSFSHPRVLCASYFQAFLSSLPVPPALHSTATPRRPY